jgi:hypothetical protein
MTILANLAPVCGYAAGRRYSAFNEPSTVREHREMIQNYIDTFPQVQVERTFQQLQPGQSGCPVNVLFGISAKASLSSNSIQ